MSVQTNFIDAIKNRCIELAFQGGELASVAIAQACCESAYGQSGLTKVSNNIFGIKGSYNGQSVDFRTSEYVNGKYISVIAAFRKYPSYTESLNDHHEFLKASRYKAVLAARDYKTATAALSAAGYATSPSYPGTLNQIIEMFHLDQYDSVKQDISGPPVQVGTVTASVLNGRRGPSTRFGILKTFERGSQIAFNGKRQVGEFFWLRDTAQYSGSDLWVRGDYISCVDPSQLNEM